MLQNNTSKPQDSVNDPADNFEVELPNTTPIQSTESSGTLTLDPPTSLTNVQENSHNIETLSSSVLTPPSTSHSSTMRTKNKSMKQSDLPSTLILEGKRSEDV
ncbi:unnamed protein product, partial [Sphacelaria rigidula]